MSTTIARTHVARSRLGGLLILLTIASCQSPGERNRSVNSVSGRDRRATSADQPTAMTLIEDAGAADLTADQARSASSSSRARIRRNDPPTTAKPDRWSEGR